MPDNDDAGSIPFFQHLTGCAPYPWQLRLYQRLRDGIIPEQLDIPTGLGKTSAVLLYLLAKAAGARIPTRLIYVVDRRAIVDQTGDQLSGWIDKIADVPNLKQAFDSMAAFPAARPVPVGVLRGGLADDGEWRVDPARPAVVVGTVDIMGSRLLFSGYGDGLSRRPFHAGLLGHDAALFLDEAHLSPAFARTARRVCEVQDDGSARAFRMMSMSATGHETTTPFQLDAADLSHPDVTRRVHAKKLITVAAAATPSERIKQIVAAATVLEHGSVVVFVRTVKDARAIARDLRSHAPERVAILTGQLRGKERSSLTQSEVWRQFDPGRPRGSEGPVHYLVTTSAGEVGVDFDADHAAMDMSTIDSIIQRLGRVNRGGLTEATVSVIALERERPDPKDPSSKKNERDVALENTFSILASLSEVSPAAMRTIPAATLGAASSPIGQLPVLAPSVIDGYSATTARLQLPPVGMFLRGESEYEPPECQLLWRWDVKPLVEAGEDVASEVLQFYRPLPAEIAKVPMQVALEVIEGCIARTKGPLPVIIRDAAGLVSVALVETAEAVQRRLAYGMAILPADAGGLDDLGMPDPSAKDLVTDIADVEGERGRWQLVGAETGGLPEWVSGAVVLQVPVGEPSEDDEAPPSVVYALLRLPTSLQDGDSDTSRFATAVQTVSIHNKRVGNAARKIGQALALDPATVETLATAGQWHDEGKARTVWQRAAGAMREPEPLAKVRKDVFRPTLLAGYRHEFGSLVAAERNFDAGVPNRDLLLHLISAHHGRSRPGFPEAKHWDPDAPDTVNRHVAQLASSRFADLQTTYGHWQLAWLEALLKSADILVSSGRDEVSNGK